MKLISLLCLFMFSGCLGLGCSDANGVDQMRQTLQAFNDAGVTYSGSLEGPTEIKAGARTEFYTGTGGWLRLNLQGPTQNPLTPQPAKLEPETGVE